MILEHLLLLFIFFTISNIARTTQNCSLFAKLDHLIELQNHKLALLQELKKGYLQKMFI